MPAMTKKEKQSLLLWLAAVCLVCALPFAGHDLAAGHDALFHILRIEGLAQAFRGGAGWPQRVYSLLCGGYGYAAGMFYPDVFLLPAALLRAVCLGPELAFKFETLLCVLATALTAYFAGRGIGRSHKTGLLLMVLYSLCQYHLTNLFIRSAVGESQAMVFLPLVVWGLYNLTEEEFSKPWVLCAAFTGLLLSHTISLALAGLFAVAWVLVRLPKVLRGRASVKLAKLAGCVGLCLALGAWFWLPMLEQFASDTFMVTVKPLTFLAANTVQPAALLNVQDYMSLGLGGLVLVPACLALLWLQRPGRKLQPQFGLCCAMTVAGLCLTALPLLPPAVWAVADKSFLTSVQFPWRLNMLGQLCLCLAATLLLGAYGAKPEPAQGESPQATQANAKKINWGRLLLPAVFLLSAANLACLWGQLPEQVNYPNNYFTSQRGETFYLVGQEWVPQGAEVANFAFEPEAQYTNSEGAFTGEYLPDGSFTFVCDGTPGLYGIPKLYYKGYTAYLQAADGTAAQPLELHRDGGGRVELTLPDGVEAGGVVTVRYTGTPLQHVADWFSLATLVGTLAYGIYAWRGKKWPKPQQTPAKAEKSE